MDESPVTGKPKTHNYFFGNPGTVDLAKVREAAAKTARGGKWSPNFSDPPTTAIIHHHLHTDSCRNKQHEVYKAVVPIEEGAMTMDEPLSEIVYPDVEEIGVD